MILVEDGYSFNDLVNFAYKEISEAVKNKYSYLIDDIVNDTNYSEICYWCKFPDLQTSKSIYERAINTAIFHVLVDNNAYYKTIKEFVSKRISDCWQSESVSANYETFSNGNDVNLIINDKQISLPKDFYNAIKDGKL